MAFDSSSSFVDLVGPVDMTEDEKHKTYLSPFTADYQENPENQVIDSPAVSVFGEEGAPADTPVEDLLHSPVAPPESDYMDVDAGRPSATGSHYEQDPLRTRGGARGGPRLNREQAMNELIQNQNYVIRPNANLHDLGDDTLGSAQRWAQEIQAMGYTPVISSAFRNTGTAGTGHRSGNAIDVGIYKDGKILGNNEEEYRVIKEAAKRAGFTSALNELNDPGRDVSPYWNNPHVHLSMHEEGEYLHDHSHDRLGVREDLRYGGKQPGGLRGTARALAMSNGINPDWFESVIEAESNFQTHDASGNPIRSQTNAMGLGQIMPATLKEISEKHGLDVSNYDNDPYVQLQASVLYYKQMLEENGDYASATAAYNAGTGGVLNMRNNGSSYGETKEYVRRIQSSVYGREFTPEEAEKSILFGSTVKYDPSATFGRYKQDEEAVTSFTGRFLSNVAEHGASDIQQGLKEYASGLTLGLSTFIPGMDPSKNDYWADLRRKRADQGLFAYATGDTPGVDKTANLMLELPWFLGSVLMGEVLAAGYATKFGAGKLAGLAPTTAEAVTANQGSIIGRKIFESTYRDALTKNGGKMGTLGRMMFGRPVHMMDNAAAHTLAFGTQSMMEGTSRRIHEGAEMDEIVKGGIADFFIGGTLGFGMAFGLPVAVGGAAIGASKALRVGRAMTSDMAAPSALDVGRRMLGNTGAASFDGVMDVAGKTAMRSGIGGFAGAVGGGAHAGLQGEDVVEGTKEGAKMGMMAGVAPEVIRTLLKEVPQGTRDMTMRAVDGFYGKLDDLEKSVFTSSIMEKAGVFEQERRAAIREVTVQNLKGNLETNINNRTQDIATIQKQIDFSMEQSKKIEKDLQAAKSARDFLEQSSSEVATYSPQYRAAMKEKNDLMLQGRSLEQVAKKNPLNKDVQAQLKSTRADMHKVDQRMQSLMKDKAELQAWSRFHNRTEQLTGDLKKAQGADGYRMAQEVYPGVKRGLEKMVEDNKVQLEHLATKGLDEPLPEGASPWVYGAADNSPQALKEKEYAERALRESLTSFVESVKHLPPDEHVLKALNRIKAQTFVDPRGDFAKDLDALIKFHEMKLGTKAAATGGRKVLFRSRGKARKESYYKDSPIQWGDKPSTFADASSLLRYAKQDQAFTGAVLPDSVMNAMRNGESLPVPSLVWDAENGRAIIKNVESLEASVMMGQKQVPVKILDKSASKRIRKDLNKYKGDLLKKEQEDLIKTKSGLEQTKRDLFGAVTVEGVETGLKGADVIKANPYNIDYKKMMSEIEQEYGINAVYAKQQLMNKELTAAERQGIMDTSADEFRNLPAQDVQDLMETRLNEYIYMFDSEDAPARMRQLALDKANGTIEAMKSSGKYIEEVGAPLIETSEKLGQRINGPIKAKAEGVLDQADVTGHSLESYTKLHGDQMAIEEYSRKLGEAFETDLATVMDDIMVKTVPNNSDGGRIARGVSNILGEEITPANLTDENVRAALTWAMDSNRSMGQLMRDVPELMPAMKSFLKHQEQWEGVLRRSPHLKAFMRPAYITHKYKGMLEMVSRSGDVDHINSVATKLSSEKQRTFDTLREAKEFAAMQQAKLGDIPKEKFLASTLDQKIELMYKRDPGTMGTAELAAAREDMEAITTGILVSNPVLDPVQLMTGKVRMTVQADTMRRFLSGLTNFEVPNAKTGKNTALLVLGSNTGARSENLAGAGYKRVAEIGGWDRVRLEDTKGASIGAKDMWIHPSAAEFLQTNAQSSSGAITENWNTFLGLLRTSTLFGTPAPHFMNTLSNNLAEFIMSPAKAIGMIGAGKKIVEDGLDGTSGEFLKLYAMQRGVNTKVMRTTTRMIAKDIQKHMGEFAPDVFGDIRGPQGAVARGLSAVDPMNAARRTAVRADMNKMGRTMAQTAGLLPEADYIVNRKMLFDVIEQSQLGGFFYRTAAYLEELRTRDANFNRLPLADQLRMAESVAKERVNEVAGAMPYMYHTDKTRKWVYNTILTPSWFLTKARSFVSSLDASLGLIVGNDKLPFKKLANSELAAKAAQVLPGGENLRKAVQNAGDQTIISNLVGKPKTRFGHLPEEVRALYAKKLVGSIATGLAAYVTGTQMVSYMVNGHSTFENPDPGKWLHLKVGEHYYNNPMFGFFRDVAKSLTGTAMGEGIEPWVKATTNQLLPTAKAVMNVSNNKDAFTGKPIFKPGAGIGEQALQGVGYVVGQTVSFDELFGGRNITIPQIYDTLNMNGNPVKRLDGREWLLRQFGVWESDYNAPARIAGEANASMSWYKQDLRDKVVAQIESAQSTNDPKRRQEYMREAYMLALRDGVEVDDKRLKEYFPNGRLRMSREALNNLIQKMMNPRGYYMKGAGKPKNEVFYYMMKQLQEERAVQEKEGYLYLIQRRRQLPRTEGRGIPRVRNFG